MRNPPLLGRRRERDLLGELLDAALAGEGGLVLVSGEAGIGKTALVSELAGAARVAGALVLAGGCYDLTTTPPYGPWIEIARQYEGVFDNDGSGTDLPELPSSLIDTGDGPAAQSQSALFEEVGDRIVALARMRPLVLVLEDLHWSDPASIDLLRAVARRCQGQQVLLAATYRADEIDRDSRLHQLLPLLVRESGARRIDLRPLELADIDALVAATYRLDDQDHHRLVDYLTGRAEGNPFFTWELLRGIEVEGLLARQGDRWALRALDTLRVPALLQQVIDLRLARLDDEVERRLTVASALGQDVPIELWCAVLGIAEPEIDETIEAAVAAAIIEAKPDGGGICFRHALYRDALYQSILPTRRRALHREIGELLATSRAPDPDAVAWHFRAAGDERAAGWLIRAGERAQRAYAWATAAERFKDASHLLPGSASGQERGWLRYRTGRLLRHADTGEAIAALREAEQLGSWLGDPILTAYARFDLGHVRVLAGEYRQGIEQMMAGDALLDALLPGHAPPGSDIAAWVADTLPATQAPAAVRATTTAPPVVNPRRGTLIQWMAEPGRYREAREMGEAYAGAIDWQAEVDEQRISSAGDSWFALGRIYAANGEPERGRDALHQALECYRRIDHHLLVSSTLRVHLAEIVIPYQTAAIALRRQMADEAEAAYRRAIGALGTDLAGRQPRLELLILEGEWAEAREILSIMASRTGMLAVWRQIAASMRGRLARECGEPDLARAEVAALLTNGPASEPGGVSFGRGIELQLLAVDLALDQGEAAEAAAWLDSLDRWLDWAGVLRWRPEAALARAHYYLVTGDSAAARESAGSALNLAGTPRQPLALLGAHRLISEIEARRGDLDTADEHLNRALNLAEQCQVPYELALTQLAIAELQIESGDAGTCATMLDAARRTFRNLGATPALERAESLAARLGGGTTAPPQPFGLSARELEVLQLVAQGLTDAEIAERLFISYRTVTTHLSSIFNKLGVNSRVSATRIAVERGIV